MGAAGCCDVITSTGDREAGKEDAVYTTKPGDKR